jgi:TRAP-type C4-dicarboxylate transport system permease small subunit
MPPARGPVERFGDVLAWLFFLGFAITVYEVLMRYVFRSPTTWVHETTTTLCALGFIFGGAYSMARNEHMRVTTAIERLSPRGRRAGEWLAIACGVIYLGVLFWGTWRQAIESVWRFEAGSWVPEPMPGPPGWPLPALVKASLAAGTLLFLLVLLAYAWHFGRSARRRD